MLLMVNHLHTKRCLHFPVFSSRIVYTLLHYGKCYPLHFKNDKETFWYTWLIGHLNTMHAHTHTHRHTKNESCSDEKAVFSEWTLWPILHVQEPILFYQALTDFLFNKIHLDTQHWPNVHNYNTANFLSETASFAVILDQMPQRKS